jgi:hypothetical protein
VVLIMADVGRPSDYNSETAEAICVRLAAGESLSSVCRDPGMPVKPTVLRWLARNVEFQTQYARAKQEGADAVAEQMFDIADEPPTYKPDGSLDPASVAYAKHRTDVRKWYLARIAPKKYGDKIQNELSGVDGVPLNIGVSFVSTKK